MDMITSRAGANMAMSELAKNGQIGYEEPEVTEKVFECTWTIDGVEQTQGYPYGGYVPNDTKVHEVVYTGIYHGNSTDGDNGIYIQPNRMKDTYVAFDVWDVKMERVNRVTAWIPAEEDEQKE